MLHTQVNERQRCKDLSGTIYGWDYLHGHVEKYNAHGHHVEDFEWPSGRRLGEPDRARRVEP